MAHSHSSEAPAPTLVAHGDDVRVVRSWQDLPTAEAGARHGGTDVPAALAGAVAALGTAGVAGVLLTALTSASGAHVAPVTQAVALLLAAVAGALAGGWTAGRAARYAGARNGLLAGLLVLLLLAASLAAGVGADAHLTRAHLPQWLRSSASRQALAAAVAAAVVLVGSVTGGALGARWHRAVDDLLLSTRPGGLPPYPEEGR
ncbi:MAG: hypothetical protein ACXVGH_10960 [Mycobacteriales bacterium]